MDIRNARILVVEDDPLIAIDAEDMLLGLGAGTVLVAHTLGEADALLAGTPIDAAVLDIRIGDGRCDRLASALRARGVPFVIATGYGGTEPGFAGVPTIGKPYAAEALLAAFASLGP
jgi:CheY-like chemotaxis protein